MLSGYSSRAALTRSKASWYCFWAVNNNTRRCKEWMWSL